MKAIQFVHKQNFSLKLIWKNGMTYFVIFVLITLGLQFIKASLIEETISNSIENNSKSSKNTQDHDYLRHIKDKGVYAMAGRSHDESTLPEPNKSKKVQRKVRQVLSNRIRPRLINSEVPLKSHDSYQSYDPFENHQRQPYRKLEPKEESSSYPPLQHSMRRPLSIQHSIRRPFSIQQSITHTKSTSTSLVPHKESSPSPMLEQIKFLWNLFEFFTWLWNSLAEYYQKSHHQQQQKLQQQQKFHLRTQMHYKIFPHNLKNSTELLSSNISQSAKLNQSLKLNQNSNLNASSVVEKVHKEPTKSSRERRQTKDIPLKSYYDFVIVEASHKFWSIFELATIVIIIYATFAGLYYAKLNPLYSKHDYIDYLSGDTYFGNSRDIDFEDNDDDDNDNEVDVDAHDAKSRVHSTNFGWFPGLKHSIEFILDAIDKLPADLGQERT